MEREVKSSNSLFVEAVAFAIVVEGEATLHRRLPFEPGLAKGHRPHLEKDLGGRGCLGASGRSLKKLQGSLSILREHEKF